MDGTVLAPLGVLMMVSREMTWECSCR